MISLKPSLRRLARCQLVHIEGSRNSKIIGIVSESTSGTSICAATTKNTDSAAERQTDDTDAEDARMMLQKKRCSPRSQTKFPAAAA